MSKTALKALANADAMIKVAGITNAAPLVEYLNDGKGRRGYDNKLLWRNADVLASLLINAAANCLQTETADTLEENGFDDMAQAMDRYVASALDAWSQLEWMDCSKGETKPELDRLLEMVNAYVAYNERNVIAASGEVEVVKDEGNFELRVAGKEIFVTNSFKEMYMYTENATPNPFPDFADLRLVNAKLREMFYKGEHQ